MGRTRTMPDTGIGASVRRKEDFRFLTGQGRFTDDIDRHGQVHAYFVRSPHAHARISRVDTSAAATAAAVIPTCPVAAIVRPSRGAGGRLTVKSSVGPR